MRDLGHVKSVVVKIGSSSLCDDAGKINHEKILKLIQQIAAVRRNGIKVTLVSSGAISAGMDVMGLTDKPNMIPEKQALAAIGQASLMQIYEDIFKLFDLRCAQILLNHDDFDDRKRLINLFNAMQAVIEYDAIPIINENDTLAVDEIKVGDNDTLAALVVPVVNADLLVLVSDIDGLYDDNPHINAQAKMIYHVDGIDDTITAMAKDTNGKLGTGGMMTKIRAAQIANDYGCDMAIINNKVEHSLVDLLAGKVIGTYFNGKSGRNLSAKDHWLMYRSIPKGKLIVDDGAAGAITEARKSLLSKGIADVTGNFTSGHVVEVANLSGEVIARGVVNYSSDEIKLIKGKNSSEIEAILQYKDYDEVIHANNMVIVKGR